MQDFTSCPAELFQAARLLAGRVTADGDGAERVVAILRDSITAGLRDGARLRSESAFAPIRETEAFRSLLAELK